MKTARIVGVVALGVLAVVCGVALSRTRLLAEGPKAAARPALLPTVSQRTNLKSRLAPDLELDAPAIDSGRTSNPFPDPFPPRVVPSLQQQFIELMKKKAERMSEDELKTAAAELQGSLAVQDREAELALQEAVIKLAEVSKKYRGTLSADKASKAIVMMGFNPDEVVIPPKAPLEGSIDDFKDSPPRLDLNLPEPGRNQDTK